MNKKFSTLVASILLASSIGTVNAAAPEFVKFKDAGTVATSVKQGAAFQLAGENNQVLALVRTGEVYKYKYELKMVAAGNDANLAETLWKITYQENKEGGPSFTFVSAAYGIPLSFTPRNVDANGVISEYPGTDGLWKWLPSLNVTGSNTFAPTALINNYSAKLDSAVVLATSGGKVVAQRYKTSGGVPSNALNLQPIVAASVVLGADDLNSMMMTQDWVEGKTKLSFSRDVLNGQANLWTKEMKAVPYKAVSFAMDDQPVYASPEEQAAATAAMGLAKAVNSAKTVSDAVTADATDKGYNGNQSLTAIAMANAAKGETAAKAIEAVEAKKGDYTAAKEKAEAELAVANTIKEEAAKFNDAEITPASTLAEYNAKIKAEKPTGTWTAIDGKTTDLKATLVSPNIPTGYDLSTAQGLTDKRASVYAYVAEEAGKLEFVSLSAYTDYNTAVEGFVDAKKDELNLTTEEVAALKAVVDIADPMTWNEAALTTAKENATLMSTYAAAIVTAANTYTVEGAVAIDDTDKFNAAVDALEITNEKLSADEITAVKNAMHTAGWSTSNAETAAALSTTDYTAAVTVATENETAATNAVTAANAVNVATTVSSAIVAPVEASDPVKAVYTAIATAATGDNIAAAVDAAQAEADTYSEVIGTMEGDKTYLSLITKDNTDASKIEYLRVDTAFLTKDAGKKHLAFATGVYNAALKNSKGQSVATNVQKDFAGRYNFKFTYFPTQDSMMIVTDGYAHPLSDGTKYADMTNDQITTSRGYHAGENYVKLAILATNTHHEVTIGNIEQIEVSGNNLQTINTRIGFNINLAAGAEIAEGVYTIQYISNDVDKKNDNGRYITTNWLPEGQAMAKVEDQNLNHIPAAQWMLSHGNGSNVNTIVNRESGEYLNYYGKSANTGKLPVQYLYATATKDLYTTVYGDSLKLSLITDKVALADSTLGYYAAAKFNEETEDQLEVYALRYLNEVENLFVNYTDKDSILNVTKSDEAEVYFRLIPAFDAVQYGASNDDLAKDLYRQAYYIQLETPNKNVKDEDKLYIAVNADGKYRLVNRKYEKIEDKNVLTWNAAQPFLLKEFKEVDGTCNYALIEAEAVWNEKEDAIIGYVLDDKKVSVKDYPSILVREDLEGENLTYKEYGSKLDGRTSTFALIQKDAPKYRRLNVTDAEDGLKDMDVNNAEFYVTRNPNRFLYENTMNKVAGYEADPLGLNFLGDFNEKELDKNAAMFVDTAYVRNNTNRPQYMLALRPDFTPVLQDCPYDPAHGKHEIPQVKASYLVTLADSVANAANKTEETKFTYENRKYTRLAFVDGIHRGDSLIILSSKFTGTKNAANDTIDLSKNAFVEGAWQFRLTGNEGAEFYIEGAKNNSFIRLINGVAVLTDDITDAERFNINKTDKTPVSNEGINADEVSVIAGNGIVTVKGAAGKAVVITNVLGQTVANTVLSSDNATIAAPAGVVVVAVEGEAAVKAIVK